ncbi:SpoIIE family protein phosphatase [Kitasatospora albolonga]|uniref:SpoIIE family protein phosphatase n=1 Tax=Kitasatospora albolonga TaxID=68173 RepID=UPI0031EE607C
MLELPGGPLLGVDPGAEYPCTELELAPGAVLALFTDGLVERARARRSTRAWTACAAPWPTGRPPTSTDSPTNCCARPGTPPTGRTTWRCCWPPGAERGHAEGPASPHGGRALGRQLPAHRERPSRPAGR